MIIEFERGGEPSEVSYFGKWMKNNCEGAWVSAVVLCSAPSVSQSVFTIAEKAPTRAFYWLRAATSAFTFKTLE